MTAAKASFFAWAAVKAGKPEAVRARGLRLGPDNGSDRDTFNGATLDAVDGSGGSGGVHSGSCHRDGTRAAAGVAGGTGGAGGMRRSKGLRENMTTQQSATRPVCRRGAGRNHRDELGERERGCHAAATCEGIAIDMTPSCTTIGLRSVWPIWGEDDSL